jgi:hypothetical protein
MVCPEFPPLYLVQDIPVDDPIPIPREEWEEIKREVDDALERDLGWARRPD